MNYIKIVWRNLVKNRASALINIGGLAAGMAVALQISLWIYDMKMLKEKLSEKNIEC
jgi:putative ABC transport system permease protein